MIQTIIVTVIVAIAALYAIKRYAPTWLVRKGGAWLSIGMAAIGFVQFSKQMAQHWTVESPTGKSCGSGCGSCGGCGTTEPVADTPATQPKSPLSGHAVIVIHRRAT